MKLNKTLILVIVVGIFLIAGVTLAMDASKQNGEKTKMQAQLSTAQTRLQSIHVEPIAEQQAGLEKQLSQLAPEFEAVSARLSQPMTSTNVAAAVYSAAASSGLTVTRLTTTRPVGENVEGVDVSAISVIAEVTGSSPDIVDFVRTISTLVKMGAVKSIEMTIPEKTGETKTPSTAFYWTSSNTSVATVDNFGLAHAVAPGTTVIIASSTNPSANLTSPGVTLMVTPEDLPSITVTPATSTITPGASLQFVATLANGTTVNVSGNTTAVPSSNTTAKVNLTVYTYEGNR